MSTVGSIVDRDPYASVNCCKVNHVYSKFLKYWTALKSTHCCTAVTVSISVSYLGTRRVLYKSSFDTFFTLDRVTAATVQPKSS